MKKNLIKLHNPFCKWVWVTGENKVYANPECQEKCTEFHKVHSFKFCPFCGKKVIVDSVIQG